MSVTDETQIRKARPEELPVASAVLARAFVDDPISAYCIPDPDRRARSNPAFFDLFVRTLAVYDEVYVAGHSGVAAWVPPDKPAIPEDAAEAFGARAAEILGGDVERSVEVIALQEQHDPTETCAHLWFLGVDPDRQSRGLGSALMAPVLARYDAERMPVYLEASSPRNRDLYLRHGFAVVSEVRLPDGTPMWPMWREPAAR